MVGAPKEPGTERTGKTTSQDLWRFLLKVNHIQRGELSHLPSAWKMYTPASMQTHEDAHSSSTGNSDGNAPEDLQV